MAKKVSYLDNLMKELGQTGRAYKEAVAAMLLRVRRERLEHPLL